MVESSSDSETESKASGKDELATKPVSEITSYFVDNMMENFRAEQRLPERDVKSILAKAKELLRELPSLVDVELGDREKLTIVGDVHGQFYDLLTIFEMNNFPGPNNRYLFNGDIVDRGGFSVECILTMLCYKILYPDKVFIARGNHESEDLNKIYGFGDEIKTKYPASHEDLMQEFQEVFKALPLAHVINHRVFVVHGGLSGEKGFTLDMIKNINRFKAVPANGVMTDLLWSDPKEACGVSKNPRGSGILFGPDVTDEFCRTNGIDLIVRSHQMMPDGHGADHGGRVLTVFSAPNYCDCMGNAGAYFTLRGGKLKPQPHVFYEAPHPDAPTNTAGNIQ